MKRKKASQTNASLRCFCKKSRCLKLYCECFTAGQLCNEFCGCHECHNSTEHRNSVSDARDNILSRNASAFSPKVVQNKISDGTYAMTTTSKHKRGCNCKKSQCLKNYCECHQVQVGCSPACRCEGCLNTFGRKDEFVEEIEKEGWGGRENYPYYGTNVCGADIMGPDQPFQHFQGFGGDDDMSRFQNPMRSYYPTTEQPIDFTFLDHYGSPANSWRNNEATGVREETLAVAPHVSGCHNAAIGARSHNLDGGFTYESRSWARPRTETEALYLDSDSLKRSQFGDCQSELGTDLYPGLQPNLQVDAPPEILASAFPPTQGFQKTSLDQKRVSPPYSGPSFSSNPPPYDYFILNHKLHQDQTRHQR